jgi:hypothetical protein
MSKPPRPGGLGYRGFLVQSASPISGIPRSFTVFRGVLTEQPGPRATYWRDVGGVEDFLLAQARLKNFGEILDALGVTQRSADRP